MSLLDKLAQAFSAGKPTGPGKGEPSPLGLPSGLIVRDESGGQPYLKLPVPKPEVLEQIAGLLGNLLGR
jgi:hypothetical protein